MGDRRKGTRFEELRAVVSAGITAEAISERLQSWPADASAAKTAKEMEGLGFDVAGVQGMGSQSVTGFVKRESLTTGTVGDHAQRLTAEVLISEASPLPVVLSALKARPQLFVLTGNETGGIVTRADLNKPPVRMYLFGIITLLEMHLRDWITQAYDGDSWQKKLTPARLKSARDLQAERRKRNQDLGLLDCLQFCDKRDLVVRRDELRRQLALGTKDEGHGFLKRAEDLRNHLAHAQPDVAGGSSWESVVDVVEWIECVLRRSDEQIDRGVETSTAVRV
ncbi:MAG: hypothetical protein HYY13_08090 [Nitrospirae bacterium]|nr:hypothetical protein [Nitrospirota bacterium]